MNEEINFDDVFATDANEGEFVEIPQEPSEEDTSVNEQEVAEPVDSEEQTEPAEAEAEARQKQSDDDNSKFAAIRRKMEAERDEIVAKIKAEAEAEKEALLNKTYAELGLENPYISKPITSKKEWEAYQQQKLEDKLSALGISKADIQQIVAETPEVKAAKTYAEKIQQTEQANKEIEFKANVEKQIAEIQKFNPNIRSIDDFRTMDKFEDFRKHVNGGKNYLEAYKLTYFDEIVQAQQTQAQQTAKQAAKQAALNVQSKSHMTPNVAKSGATVATVPREDYKMFKTMFGDEMTDAEIAKYYNKYIKSLK
jgi:hypothetical protein